MTKYSDATPKPAGFKKRKKGVKKGALSFGDDEETEESTPATPLEKSRSATPATADTSAAPTDSEDAPAAIVRKRLKPNASVAFQAKAQTKSSLAKEAQLKEGLRKQYLQMQEAVKATEFIIPFVFFEGKEIDGGKVRLKKADFVWLFLERARKVGAELADEGKGPAGSGARRREWARISVDDLMLVKGEMILPHVSPPSLDLPVILRSIDFRTQHVDFYTMLLNKSCGYKGPLFPTISSEPTTATPKSLLPSSNPGTPSGSDPEPAAGLLTADQLKAPPAIPDAELEGSADDPALVKVIDRRWYEKNKHIYPMSIWEDFDVNRDYSQGGRKDREGNNFFFSSR